MKNRIIALLAVSLLVTGCAASGKVWDRAEKRKQGARFIPIELWTGENWDGDRSLNMDPANSRFGSRRHKSITGPIQWRHPKSGKDMIVYERINETTKGTKRQLFTVNPGATGLAKVFDSRPGGKTRYQSPNAVLFPLGWWKKGERREYVYTEHVDGKKYTRKATLRMRRLSFKYKGIEHAMKYDWIMVDAQGSLIYHERFIYAPGKGLIYFKNRLKKKP